MSDFENIKNIAYLGPECSFSEMAKDKFGYNKSPKTDTYMHVKSFPLISAIDYNNITLLGHDELKDFLKNKIYNSGILEDFSQFTKELNSKIN